MSDASQVTATLSDEEYLRRLFADPERAARSAADDATALDFLDYVRWEGEIRCPHCGSERYTELNHAQFVAKRRRRCMDCRLHFSTINKTPLAGLRVPAKAIAIAVAHDEDPQELAARLSREAQVSNSAALGLAYKARQWRDSLKAPADPEQLQTNAERNTAPNAEEVAAIDAVLPPPEAQPDPAPVPSEPVASEAYAPPQAALPATPEPAAEPPRPRPRVLRRDIAALAGAILVGAVLLSVATVVGLRQVRVSAAGLATHGAEMQLPVRGTDRLLVAYWSHEGRPMIHATYREDHERRDAWSQRHNARASELMQEFPPDQ